VEIAAVPRCPSTPGGHSRAEPRGQALVELAIVLPILVLLLLLALDLGRVFFGYVALQNASRIGANHAATFDQAWVTGGGPIQAGQRDQYEQLVLNDLQAINCDADPDGDGDSVPDPVFRNPDGTTGGSVHDPGDHAMVRLSCEFGLLTPLAETLLGGPVALSAESVFPVHEGSTLGLPSAAPPPPPVCDPPEASFSTVPQPGANGRIEGARAVTVTFTDTSTTDASCPILTWEWDFGNGPPVPDETTADTMNTFTHPGSGGPVTFVVTLTVTNDGGSDTASINVRVTRN
jgi:hypothetical protein